jgi:hypothetical protein
VVLAVILIVAFAALSLYLWWQLVTTRRAWQPEREKLGADIRFLEFKIDLAKRLIARDVTLSQSVVWKMWDGPTKQGESLSEALDHEEAPDSGAGNIDPLPPL